MTLLERAVPALKWLGFPHAAYYADHLWLNDHERAYTVESGREHSEMAFALLDAIEAKGYKTQLGGGGSFQGQRYFNATATGEGTGEYVDIGYGDSAECLQAWSGKGRTRTEAVLECACALCEREGGE